MGLPNYTRRPRQGEMSLGVGRKRTNDEHELSETNPVQNEETGGADRAHAILHDSTLTTQAPKLPPYVPPPPSAVVTDSRSVLRM